MKVSISEGLATLALAVLLVAPVAAGTATCALPLDCASRNPPQPGPGQPACGPACGASKNVWHGQWNPCGGFGGFDLTATRYRMACGVSGTANCPVADVPPVRFWDFGNGWATGNSGCQRIDDPLASWMANKGVDDGVAGAEGFWYLYQANWAGPGIDKCGAVARTIVDITDVDAGGEGTVDHGSWYLVASVAEGPVGQFDLDNIAGGTSCGTSSGNIVPAAVVLGLTIAGKTTPCTGGAIAVFGRLNPNGPSFTDVDIQLVEPSPSSYRDAGGPGLIAGYQIVYATGTEPTTSSWWSGIWQPARDPADPSLGAALVPPGTTTVVTVAFPGREDAWFAARIIYVDATENPVGTFANPGPPTTSVTGPILGTHVSGHCGPVAAWGDPVILPVVFASLEARRLEDGAVRIAWTTASEDDADHFSVLCATDPQGTEGLTEVAPYVEARGAFRPYEVLDVAAAGDRQATRYYFVQEWTASGPGTRSPVVEVRGDAGAGSKGRGGAAASGQRRRGPK